VILALSGGQKTALLIMAGIFITFALASSFLLPRRDPDYPGRRLRLFVAVAVLLTVAMLTSMAVFAKESDEEGAPSAEPGTSEPAPGTTQGGGETTAPPSEQQGDPAAGKEVFASAGCTGCHTLADAGATGTVGPNLDDAKPPHDLVVDRVTNGKGPMPSFKGQLSEEQIQNVAAYVSSVAGKS
jgi:cytochrome c6